MNVPADGADGLTALEFRETASVVERLQEHLTHVFDLLLLLALLAAMVQQEEDLRDHKRITAGHFKL